MTHQVVNCGGSNGVDEVDDNFDNEDAEHKGSHGCGSKGAQCNVGRALHTLWMFFAALTCAREGRDQD